MIFIRFTMSFANKVVKAGDACVARVLLYEG